VDPIDFAVYRYLSPDGLVRFWGSRRVVDPRVSAREIADRVGLSEAGVRIRLRGLEQRGFLRGRETGVNPSLFDVSLVVSEIPIREPSEADRVLRELALVDGVTFARDVLDEKDREIRVFYVSDNPSATARRTALLKRMAPSGELRGPTPYWIPACEHALSRLDWRLLRAYRRHPEAGVGDLAKVVGISLKTTALHFRRLLESRACWSSLSMESEEMPLALLTVEVGETAARASVATAVARANPVWIPAAPDGLGVSPSESPLPVAGLVPAEAPAALEQSIRKTRAIEGVARVSRTFALGSASYPAWVDERLAEAESPSAPG